MQQETIHMFAWERSRARCWSWDLCLFERDMTVKHHTDSSSIVEPDHTVVTTKACAAEVNFQLSGVNCSFTSGLYVSCMTSINVLLFLSALLYNWILIRAFNLQPQAPFGGMSRARSAFMCFYDAPKMRSATCCRLRWFFFLWLIQHRHKSYFGCIFSPLFLF